MDVVALLSTELVTNAVVHGRGPVGLLAQVDEITVLVEVHDHGASVPVVRASGLEATSGRGLRLVAHLASRWGVRTTVAGKCVWFSLTLPYDPGGSDRPCDVAVLGG